MSDAGSVDLLQTLHGVCDSRECSAKTALEKGWSGEMGGGTYTYLTLPGEFLFRSGFDSHIDLRTDQFRAGNISETALEETVKSMLRTKFALGLFESKSMVPVKLHGTNPLLVIDPYPYADYNSTLRTTASQETLLQMEREAIVLLENRNDLLPLGKDISSIALIGPQVDRVSVSTRNFRGPPV